MTKIHDPATCPCDYPCPRNKDCEACKAYHHGQGGKTACERRAEQAARRTVRRLDR